MQNRREVKDIIKNDKNLIAVFSGHQHWTKRTVEDGVEYYVLGSLVEDVNDDGVPDGVYFEIDITENRLEVEEHHLKLN